jgi:signal transduction histidine kinase/HPt (histidine-containing phosphotransfer) domain-containing protein/response regulator of citrate/malate metabolism
MVLLVSIFVTIYMNRTIKMVELATQNHLKAAAQAAAAFLSVEELDNFHTLDDMEKTEWDNIHERLVEFAEQYQVLYVYYWRDYGDGNIQYIIDNDMESETMANPEMFFSYTDPDDPITSAVVPLIMAGNTYIADLGMYTEEWGGLISGVVPVFNKDGSVYCAAGVDISDEIIIIQRRNMAILRSVLILALSISLFSSGMGIMFYRRKALQSDSANQAKSQFLSTMSHEIRTPMNAVIGISEMVLREDTSPRVREYIRGIKQAGGSLLSIINDILDFSKIEAGKMELHPGPYALSSLLNDTASIISIRLHEKNLKFKVDIDESLPGILMGDEIRLRQILLNLLSNAVKYTREGHIEFNVSGESIDNDTLKIKFEVSDTGIGIKKEDLKTIFGTFSRFDSENNRGVEGTGLGLAITYNLCQLMGAAISVTSIYGKGSTFTVVLPQKIIDFKPIAKVAASENYHNASFDFVARFSAPDARVLIVDDVSSNLLVAEGLLAPYKMQIDCCGNGAGAVALVKKNHYDLIFMDHMMAGMDGIEATAKIREWEKSLQKEKNNESLKKIPIVALTANAVSGMREMFLEKGFNDYLSKPIDIAKLDGMAAKWIPKEKQIKTGAETARMKFDGDTGLAIPGVDTAKGINMTGGTLVGYKKVLASFINDARERKPHLVEAPTENELGDFTTHVHALKSAAGTIGAAELSKEATELEAAGKAGDMSVIEKKLPGFYEHMEKTVEEIRKALETKNKKPEVPKNDTGNSALYRRQFFDLKEALEKKDMETIDRIIADLEKGTLTGEIKKCLDTVSELLLVSKFKAALAAINTLLEEHDIK